ncbi:hypothetical protein MIR68_003185 [Amoeboaphelidium protococcarum]|nr:hypothetical protein MIR68_003185 [Amoeboaphelidium protococcarum]
MRIAQEYLALITIVSVQQALLANPPLTNSNQARDCDYTAFNSAVKQTSDGLDAETMKAYFRRCLSESEWSEVNKQTRFYYIGNAQAVAASETVEWYPYIDIETDEGDVELNLVPGDFAKFRYEVRQKLGDGQFSKVYSAFDHKEQQLVALKIAYYAEAIDQLKNEISILVDLNQLQNGVSSSIGYDPGLQYITRLLDMFVWKDSEVAVYPILLPVGKVLPVVNAHLFKQWTYGLIMALRYIHDKGYQHCDIKPQNLLFDPVTYQLVVSDLGSAEKYDNVNAKDTIGGTLDYEPPEANSNVLHERFDVYQMGLTLFDLAIQTHLSRLYLPGEARQFGSGQFRQDAYAILKSLQENVKPQLFSQKELVQLAIIIAHCIRHNLQQRPSYDQLLNVAFTQGFLQLDGY